MAITKPRRRLHIHYVNSSPLDGEKTAQNAQNRLFLYINFEPDF
jgi:hypothetical protein